MEEIVNRVENSGLLTIDLRDLSPAGPRMVVDLKDFLYEGVMVREKHFREQVDAYDWSQFKDAYVGITCSVDAIVPLWVYMILSSKLEPYAALVIRGNKAHLEGALLRRSIEELSLEEYEGQRVIIKGCGGEVPESAYITLTARLQPVVKSLMFGEACSTVPVFKAG